MLEEKEFNDFSYADTKKNYENKLNKTYSSVLSDEQHIDTKEKAITDFIIKYGPQMRFEQTKDPEEVFKRCEQFVEFKNDKEITEKWNKIKDSEKLLGRFNSFLNIKDTIKDSFDKAEEKAPKPPER